MLKDSGIYRLLDPLAIALLSITPSVAEKDEELNAFRDNQTQIIVSTTVIEVGVDVCGII